MVSDLGRSEVKGQFRRVLQASVAHHFVLMVDSGAPAHQMLHHLEVALGGGSLQGRVSGL